MGKRNAKGKSISLVDICTCFRKKNQKYAFSSFQETVAPQVAKRPHKPLEALGLIRSLCHLINSRFAQQVPSDQDIEVDHDICQEKGTRNLRFEVVAKRSEPHVVPGNFLMNKFLFQKESNRPHLQEDIMAASWKLRDNFAEQFLCNQ